MCAHSGISVTLASKINTDTTQSEQNYFDEGLQVITAHESQHLKNSSCTPPASQARSRAEEIDADAPLPHRMPPRITHIYTNAQRVILTHYHKSAGWRM